MSLRAKWLKISGYGALWLTSATFVTKLIGVLQKIPLQNLAGDAAFGIYNIVYPIYQLMMALAIAGIPTALAFYIAQKNEKEQHNVLSVALIVISGAAVVSCMIGLLAAPWLAKLIGNIEVVTSIRMLALALLITPLLAVYRGYYQGKDDARASSISQLIEQCVRVACMLLLLWIGLIFNWSDSKLAAAVMFGSVIGAIAALIWLLSYQKGNNLVRIERKLLVTEGNILFRMALPTALAAIVVPMVAVVDAISIPRFMLGVGEQVSFVMAEFGRYSRIQPLIQLVSMLLGAFAAGFIPNWVKQDSAVNLGDRLLLIHRLAWMIGAAAAVGLFFLASPLNIMLYKDAESLTTFRILSWTTLASSMLAVQVPLLQAAGVRKLPLYLLLIAAGSKAILNYAFVPIWGIEGAALAGNIALFVPAIIGALALRRATNHMNVVMNCKRRSWLEALRLLSVTLLALVLMVLSINIVSELIGYIWPLGWHMRLCYTLETLSSVIVGSIVFGAIIMVFKGITKSELKLLNNQT
ncbi:MAG: polysaccharide biosynthesis protein [Candidatus Pristimantibacillus lignocellulolyticus]|uniref:Polysaccharide biosynthesis protein n=1 Tax=Candidatus Pristimantibacillus lignocellulolyticus TaxID=2994561 RepID=A0A9J6ZJG8_9BACL|nr:MAG: polysaccharide biosynthesis protein [Candidatus Pristimantibacillus lignocellulolyticus]